MPEGVKLIDCKLTPQEWEVIKVIQAEPLEYGHITFNVYYQRGKIIRVERKEIIVSKMIKS